MDTNEISGLAQALKRLEGHEDVHAEIKCRRDMAERFAAQFALGSDLQRGAAQRFRERTDELRMKRRELAQAIVDAYALGIGLDGQIIWKED